MKSLLHLLHIAGVIVWVGGMFFAHVCLRPVAAAQLPPPQRLPLLAAVLGRFFVAVAISIVAILASGLAIMLPVGMGHAPIHWHTMLTLGLVMTGIFAYIALGLYPRLKRGVAAQDWPAAGASMNRIRGMVLTNLILGATTVVVAILGTYA
nr:CopD family protein [Dechloromonas sp.]